MQKSAKRRAWKDWEYDALDAMYSKVHINEICRKLNRTRSSVYQMANQLGLNTPRDPKARAKLEKQVARHHAKGWSDSEVANAMGIPRRNVTYIRDRIGLKAHDRSERYRRRVAEITKKQCEAAGVKSLVEIKKQKVEQLAQELGWPSGLRLRSIEILELLWKMGPMTRRQISKAIGLPWRGGKCFGSKVPGGSYLAELQRLGLVIQLPRVLPRGGKGRNDSIYMLQQEVEPCRKAN